jgi:glycosyltransferase involved in cell wall biosynthesis
MAPRRFLLLTNIPPCDVDAGGLVINKLCRLFEPGSLACFAVMEPYWVQHAAIPPDLEWMPFHGEADARRPFGGAPAKVAARGLDWWQSSRATRLVRRAAQFGRSFGVDAIWCHLAGEMMYRLAVPLAAHLNIPLYTQVLDPPELWFGFDRVPPSSQRRLQKAFTRTLNASVALAAISDPMRDEYSPHVRGPSFTLPPGIDASLSVDIPRHTFRNDELVIGVSGNLHQAAAWSSLLGALQSNGWRVAGRDVRIRVLSRSLPILTSEPANIDFRGWRSQHETIRLLAETDVLYCPSWFEAESLSAARLSFPSKLAPYFAAGRPVLFHGPPDSAGGRFIAEHKAGLCCTSLDHTDIIRTLGDLMSDDSHVDVLASNARNAFHSHLTTDTMQSRFHEFLGIGGRTSAHRP